MITGDDAVSAMYRFLNKNSKAISLEKGRLFKYMRPKRIDAGEYIVINHLPFVRQKIVEEGVVNVNVHVPCTASNEPNTKRLQQLVKNMLTLFVDSTYIDGVYFDFYSDSRPTQDNDNTYYINLKFNVTYKPK